MSLGEKQLLCPLRFSMTDPSCQEERCAWYNTRWGYDGETAKPMPIGGYCVICLTGAGGQV